MQSFFCVCVCADLLKVSFTVQFVNAFTLLLKTLPLYLFASSQLAVIRFKY